MILKDIELEKMSSFIAKVESLISYPKMIKVKVKDAIGTNLEILF